MTQSDKLIKYIKDRIAPSGLTLSKFGISEIQKRFNKTEDAGGYSNYWKTL